MSSIRDNVFFTMVAPILGGIIGVGMFTVPLLAVLKVRRSGNIGALNPLPMCAIVINCLGWIVYSSHQRDVHIFWPNALAMYIAVFMSLSLYPYTYKRNQNIMAATLVLGTIVYSVEGFTLSMIQPSAQVVQWVWGITANCWLLVFYSSPLSEMVKVVREHNSAYFFWPMSLLAFMNGSLWFAYGMALQDWFVYSINGAGAVLSALQLVLCWIYPGREAPEPPVLAPNSSHIVTASKGDVEMRGGGFLPEGRISTEVDARV